MGFFDKILGAIAGEDPEVKMGRQRMQADAATDPRRAFVFGILAISYDVDPGYLVAHSKQALGDWYNVRTPADIEGYRFGSPDGGAYDGFRHAFLARAGFAAGLLPEARSWELAFRQAANVAGRYRGWQAYGEGYLLGHQAYRRSQGDSAEQLAIIATSRRARMAELARGPWARIPYSFA